MALMRILSNFNGWSGYNSIVEVDETNEHDLRVANNGVAAGFAEWADDEPAADEPKTKAATPPPPDPVEKVPSEDKPEPTDATEPAPKRRKKTDPAD